MPDALNFSNALIYKPLLTKRIINSKQLPERHKKYHHLLTLMMSKNHQILIPEAETDSTNQILFFCYSYI